MACIQTKPRLSTAIILTLVVALPAGLAARNQETPGPVQKAQGLWKEGAVLHVEGKYQEAIDRFRAALALHPTARTHTYLAWSLSMLGRYEDAVAQTRKAIAVDPQYPNAYNDLGAYLIELNEPAKALPWLEKAIGMPHYCCPHYSYYQIGRAMLRQGYLEAAKEALRRSLAVKPRYRAPRDLLQRIQSSGFNAL